VPSTERIAADLKKSGRDIVLSVSNSTPFEIAGPISKTANVWRTTGDIEDHWGSLKKIASSQEKWQPYAGPGHWNDPDILQIGKLGKPNQPNTTFVQTQLTPDEQYTHVTLWCLLSAPLIISCDLEHIDSFTMGLLTNDEVIAVDQDPAARPARKAWHRGDFQVWTKELSDGSVAAGFFNTGKEKGVVKVNLRELGLSGAYEARDLWKRADQGTVTGDMAVELNSHGAAMFRFSKKS
jgi:alpha-galactosidase